uniref:Uncharacterized protein n=2 Tax=Phaeomonas parva TaxID=124430 RepID=A0A7S1UDW9_9STRA
MAEIQRLSNSARMGERKERLEGEVQKIKRQLSGRLTIEPIPEIAGDLGRAALDLASGANNSRPSSAASSRHESPRGDVDTARNLEVPFGAGGSGRMLQTRNGLPGLRAIPEDKLLSSRRLTYQENRLMHHSSMDADGTFAVFPLEGVREERVEEAREPVDVQPFVVGVGGSSTDPRHPPAHALDPDLSKVWISTGAFPQFLSMRFRQTIMLYNVTLQCSYVHTVTVYLVAPPRGRPFKALTSQLPATINERDGKISGAIEAYEINLQGFRARELVLEFERGYDDFCVVHKLQIQGNPERDGIDGIGRSGSRGNELMTHKTDRVKHKPPVVSPKQRGREIARPRSGSRSRSTSPTFPTNHPPRVQRLSNGSDVSAKSGSSERIR